MSSKFLYKQGTINCCSQWVWEVRFLCPRLISFGVIYDAVKVMSHCEITREQRNLKILLVCQKLGNFSPGQSADKSNRITSHVSLLTLLEVINIKNFRKYKSSACKSAAQCKILFLYRVESPFRNAQSLIDRSEHAVFWAHSLIRRS
jgi:hypothetical protein